MPITIQKTTFERREFDVTNTCQFVCGCCATQNLFLEEEEILLSSKNVCGSSDKRLPYGELGSVEEAQACGCCVSFGAGTPLAGPATAEGAGQGISPGCG
eukprot:gene20889-22742_t